MSGATNTKISWLDRLKMTVGLHKKNAISSLIDIFRQPTNSLLTILVLAIALALPSAFFLFSKNAQSVSNNWDSSIQMSLFLEANTTIEQAESFADELSLLNQFERVHVISKQQALDEFKNNSGFAQALELLAENPLPMVIELNPTAAYASSQDLELLLVELQQNSIVESAKLDMEWINKYLSIIDISQKVGIFVAILLAFGVLLIIGNTIRLAILNRREEIQIIKLVGATDAFIRRPFLYTGFWYGLIAAFIAALLIAIFMLLLGYSVQELAIMYNSNFELQSLSPSQTLLLLLFGACLGLAGAWVSVRKHLKDIQPS